MKGCEIEKDQIRNDKYQRKFSLGVNEPYSDNQVHHNIHSPDILDFLPKFYQNLGRNSWLKSKRGRVHNYNVRTTNRSSNFVISMKVKFERLFPFQRPDVPERSGCRGVRWNVGV